MDTQAKKAGKGKAPAKAARKATTIDLVKDKPFDWEKYADCPPNEIPEPDRGAKYAYENWASAYISIPNLFFRELPQEWEICLKYKDEDVRIIGNTNSVICGNIQQVNEPAIKLILKSLACYDGDVIHQPHAAEEAA